MTKLTDMSEREYFACVADRLGMFIRRSSLAGLEAFLDGYDQHALRHGGPGLAGWTDWLEARLGYRSSLVWQGLVRIIALPEDCDPWALTAEQEAHVIAVLFALLDDFLAAREADRPAGDS